MAFSILETTQNPQLAVMDHLADALANKEITLAQYTRAAMLMAEKMTGFESQWENVKSMARLAPRAGMGDMEGVSFKRAEIASQVGEGLVQDLTDTEQGVSLPQELAQLTAAKVSQHLGKSQASHR